MSIKYSNDARSTLSNGITPSSTLLTVISTVNFPSLVGGDYTYLTLADATEAVKEIVKCTAINGNELTVIRGEESTTAQSFDSGAHVQLRITAGLINEAIAESIFTPATSEDISFIDGLQDALDSKLTPTGDGSQLTGIEALPIQTGGGGNFLTTDGTNATWQGLSFEIDGGSATSVYLTTQLVNGGPA